MAQNSFLEKDNPVDFFYLDRQRISSLIGQLSDRGMLTGLKASFGKSHSHEGTAGGSVAVAKVEGKTSRVLSESSEETYDPFWTHAYTFLQDLEANFAVPLDSARLGSLVKFQAIVQFLDLKIMQDLWEPSARAFLHSQPAQSNATSTAGSNLSRKKRREQQRQAPQQVPPIAEAVKLGLDVLKAVPHLLHMTFLAPPYRLWAPAQPEYLTISGEHLSMKFGAVVDGIWTVLGIVDGMIGEPRAPLPINSVLDGFTTAMSGLREMIGRPRDHWGLSLIGIYAPIQGCAEAEADPPAPSPNQPE